jgi:hypothetical protein
VAATIIACCGIAGSESLANSNSGAAPPLSGDPLLRIETEARNGKSVTITTYEQGGIPASLPEMQELIAISQRHGLEAPEEPSELLREAKFFGGNKDQHVTDFTSGFVDDREAKTVGEIFERIDARSFSHLYVHPVIDGTTRLLAQRWALTIAALTISGTVTYYGFYHQTGSAGWAVGAALMMAGLDGAIQYNSEAIGRWVTDAFGVPKDKLSFRGMVQTLGKRGSISVGVVFALMAYKVASPAINWEPTGLFAAEMYKQLSWGIGGMLFASTPQIESLKMLKTQKSTARMDRYYRLTFFSLTMYARAAMIIGVTGSPVLSKGMLGGLLLGTGAALLVVNKKVLAQVEADKKFREKSNVFRRPLAALNACASVFSVRK